MTVTMPGAELDTAHPGRPGEGLLQGLPSQTFLENHSVPGTVLATGDTEMNGTHCPLILAPLHPPFSLLGPVPEPRTERGTKDGMVRGKARPGDLAVRTPGFMSTTHRPPEFGHSLTSVSPL